MGGSHDFVERWIKRYEESGSVQDRPRSGRPNSLSKQAQAEACLALQAGESSSSVARRFTATGLRVTAATIRNVAKRRRLVYRVAKSKPALRMSHKLARFEFAKKARPRTYWNRHCSATKLGSASTMTHEAGGWSRARPPLTEQQ